MAFQHHKEGQRTDVKSSPKHARALNVPPALIYNPFRRDLFITTTVMVVIAVAILAALNVGLDTMSRSGANTPSGAVNTFVRGINSGSFDRVYGVSTVSLYFTVEEENHLRQASSTILFSISIQVLQSETIYKDYMGPVDRQMLEEVSRWFYREHDITVQDYVLQRVTAVIYEDGQNLTETLDIPCLKVDGIWYVHML